MHTTRHSSSHEWLCVMLVAHQRSDAIGTIYFGMMISYVVLAAASCLSRSPRIGSLHQLCTHDLLFFGVVCSVDSVIWWIWCHT